MNRKTLIISACFFFVIVLSLIFIKQFMDNSTKESKRNNIHSPDAFLLNARYLRTDEQGHCEMVLFSPHVKHFSYKDSSEFIDPKIFVYRNKEEWHITSKKARGLNGADTFFLTDNVFIRQLPSKTNPETLLSTQALTLFPKKNLVTTNNLVTISQPGLKISSIGLRGDFNTGKIQLLSKTKGQYDPNRH